MLRQFAGLWILFFGAIGCLQLYKGSGWGWTWIGVSLAAGVPGLFRPQVLKPVFVIWMILVFPIGWAVSHIILAVVFFGVFTPLGFVIRALGHDSLFLKRPKAESYWQTKTQQQDVRRYLRQF